jgi:hypothetical protein
MNKHVLERIRNPDLIPYVLFAICVLGAKLAIIGQYGNATPFWDQWDAEADELYRPWLEGSLQWADLFTAHNEHRIFTTRLLALVLFELNGQVWNPVLQMQINAVLHTFALSVLLFYLSKALSSAYRIALFVFSALLFSIPFGWENTLAGFQSQFYFLLLFSFVFLWSMCAYETYSAKWWSGTVTGGLCLVTLASGALTVLAGSLVLIIRRVLAGDKEGTAISAILLLVVMAIIAIVLTPTIGAHGVLKAQSVTQFLLAFATVISWPVGNVGIGILIVQMPLCLGVFKILRDRDYHSAHFFFIVAVAAWLFGQFFSIAYGRAVGASSSRYLDLFAISLALNFSMLMILRMQSSTQYKLRYGVGIAIWLMVVGWGFSMSASDLSRELRKKAHEGVEQEKNVRAYLCSGDFAALQKKPRYFVPYPDPDRLKSLLDNPTIRKILPGNIYGPNSRHHFRAEGKLYCDPAYRSPVLDVLK